MVQTLTNRLRLRLIHDQERNLAGCVRVGIQMADLLHTFHREHHILGTLQLSDFTLDTDGTVHWTEQADGHAAYAYRAPEQFGRIHRQTDERSDLYAVGVMLYELITGRMPIALEEGETWSEAHLTKPPSSLAIYRPEAAGGIERIIAKLLEKSPESRYQTAYGLSMDLRRWAANPKERFEEDIGEYDRRCRFHSDPEALIGRQTELKQLTDCLRAAEQRPIVATLSGASGAGKTRLVREWKRAMQREGIVFAETSFADGGAAKDAHTPLDRAKRQWLNQIICQGVDNDEALRAAGLSADTALPGMKGRTLALFVDDAGEMDAASAAELTRWLVRAEKEKFGFFLATAGVNEEESKRPWNSDAFAWPRVDVRLRPLEYGHVLQWLGGVVHDQSPRVQLLASALYRRSEGMPGRIKHTLDGWHAEQLLTYHDERHRWEWPHDLIAESPHSELYLQTMQESLAALPPETRDILVSAACVGMYFPLQVLSEVMELPTAAVNLELSLRPAEQAGIVSPDDEAGVFVFLSAPIQRLLFEQIPENVRAEWHCRIGDAYERYGGGEESASEEARKHWNAGAWHLSDDRRRELAERNFKAGLQAYEQRKYMRCKRDLELALSLVWNGEGEPDAFACKVLLHLVNANYYRGDVEKAKEGFEALHPYLRKLSREDGLLACLNQLEILSFRNLDLAMTIGNGAMKAFGRPLPERSSPLRALAETLRTVMAARRLDRRDDALPMNEQFEYTAQSRLMIALFSILMQDDPVRMLESYAKFIRYSFKQGRSAWLLELVSVFEMLLQRGLPPLYRWWPKHLKSALHPGRKRETLQSFRSLYAAALLSQLDHPDKTAGLLFRAIRRAVEQGDVVLVNLAAITCVITHTGTAEELDDLLLYLENEASPLLDDTSRRVIGYAERYAEACKDISAMESYIAIPVEGPAGEAADSYDCLLRAEQAYIAGRHRYALHWTARARERELSVDWVRNRRLRVVEALAQLALYPEASADERRTYARAISSRIRSMKAWQGAIGKESAALWVLKAEWDSVNGKRASAILAFEEAARRAREQSDSWMMGIAYERMALYHAREGAETSARLALVEAIAAFGAWGHAVKVRLLERGDPRLAELAAAAAPPEPELSATANDARTIPQRAGSPLVTMDDEGPRPFATLQLEELLAAVCRETGADRGIVAEVTARERRITEAGRYGRPSLAADAAMAAEVVRAVHLTQEPAIVPNAEESDYGHDPYIRKARTKSLFCMPMRLPTVAKPLVLYLEHTEVPGAFSDRTAKEAESLVKSFSYLSLFKLPIEAAATGGSMPAAQETAKGETPEEPLTVREEEVLRAIAAGYSNKEIAELLFISEATVKTHTHRLYGKLGVKRRGQAIAKARELTVSE